MKSILLCEGKSDAILISYYLQKVKGWQFSSKKDKRKVKIPLRNDENEEVNWYTLDNNLLAIWGIGGKDNFPYAIQQIFKLVKLEKEETFHKIVILTDRDKSENDNIILSQLSEYLGEVNLRNNEWAEKQYINDFENNVLVKILPIIIPFDKQGALETFILDAISEMGEEEDYIVNKSKEYISSFNLNNYLNSQRLKIKGELSVALGTLFPQRTFMLIDEMLIKIEWEKYRTIQEGFRKLEEI